jgi:hypothetical protein
VAAIDSVGVGSVDVVVAVDKVEVVDSQSVCLVEHMEVDFVSVVADLAAAVMVVVVRQRLVVLLPLAAK